MTTRYLVVPLLLALLALPSAAVDVDKYIKDLSAPDASVRWTAASTLGSLGDTVAVDSLMTSLRDESFKVRQAAAWSLGELRDAKAAGALIQTLQTRDFYDSYEDNSILREDQLRTAAAEALGKLNSSLAVGPLIQALLDEKASIRAAAAEAGW